MSLRCLIVEDQVMFLQLLCTMLRGLRGPEVVATPQAATMAYWPAASIDPRS